ncbi:MAG: hypothetical protein AABW67_04320 [Nanoarchaeota archaeon]
MEIQKGNFYKILIGINNATLTYKCKVISIDKNFITFIDDRGKTYDYNIKCILSSSDLGYEFKINGGDSNE